MDATATEAQEIGRAMQKVAGNAASVGLEYEKLASWIATVSSRTRESAEVIGTSFNTILSRYYQLTKTGFNEEDETKINDVVTALAEAGIQARDGSGGFRDLGDVIDELGGKWDTLTQDVQRYVLTTMAGTRQQSRLANLLNDYSQSVELYEGALNAAGTTQDKYNKYLQSTEAYLNRLNATATGVWQKVFDSDTIRAGISLLTKIVESFDWLIDKFGFIPTVAIPATIALGMFNKTIQSLLVGLGTSIASMLGLTASTTAAGVAATGAATAFSAFWASLGPIGAAAAAIGALSFGIQKVVDGIGKAQAKQRDIQEQNDKILLSYNAQGKEIDSLVQRYTDLTYETTLSVEQQEELRDVQNKLNAIVPQFTSYVDANGDAHLRNADAIAAELQYLKEFKKLQDEEFIGQFNDKIKTQTKLISDLNDKIEELSRPKLYDTKTGQEVLEKRIERERELLASQRELKQAEDELSNIYSEAVIAKLNLNGALEQLDSTEQRYIANLAKEEYAHDTNGEKIDQLSNKITDLITWRDKLNQATEDSTKHLTLEQTSILNRLGLMDDEIQATGLLTDAIIKLAKARLQERMSADPAFQAGRDQYVGGNYASPYAKQIADIAALEQSLKQRDSVFNRVTGAGRGGGGASKDFSKQFEFATAKVRELDTEIDKLRTSLERVTDIEDKQAIYDQLLDVYKQKENLLKQMRSYYEIEFNKANQTIQKFIAEGKIAFDDQNRLFSTIKDEVVAKALDNFQRLQSELNSTNSALREVENTVYSLGKTMQDALAQEIENRVKLSFYFIQKEIDALERAKQSAKENAEERIKGLEEEIRALEKQGDLANELAQREKYQNEILKLQIQLRNTMAEKNIRQLRQKEDGSFEYVYVADPERVADLNEQISNKLEDFAKWEADLNRKRQIDRLRNQIETIREELRQEEARYNRQIQNLRDFMTQYNDEYAAFDINHMEWLGGFIEGIKKLESEGYEDRITALQAFVTRYNAEIERMKSPSSAGGGGGVYGGTTASGSSSSTANTPRESATYEIDHEWGHNYRIEKDGYEIYKDGKYVPAENFKYLPKDVLEKAREMKKNAASFDGGGMTPAWGPEGKWGILHEKERVLSEQQTNAFEKLVDSLPLFGSLLSKISLPSMRLNSLSLQPSLAGTGIKQTVQIGSLVFPNVKDGKEIENAITNLSTYANQWANRK